MPWAIARASWMVASTTPFDADRRPCLLREDSHSGPGQERQMPLLIGHSACGDVCSQYVPYEGVTVMRFKVASRVRGLSDEAFREAFGTEEQCRTALVRLRWNRPRRATMPILHIAAPGPLERCGWRRAVLRIPRSIRSAVSRRILRAWPADAGIVLSDDFPEIDEHLHGHSLAHRNAIRGAGAGNGAESRPPNRGRGAILTLP